MGPTAPTHRNPIHLYRHLLRQTSYLPGPLQPAISLQISKTFRDHATPPLHLEDATGWISARLQAGNEALCTLRAAVGGHSKALREVAYAAFGRIGARREELMKVVATKEPRRPVASNSAELERALQEEKQSQQGTLPSHDQDLTVNRYPWLREWDLPFIMALARSQRLQEGNAAPDAFPKKPISGSLSPEDAVPAENAWGRPLPPRRRAAVLARWWQALASKLAPPVSREEWELLRRLALGMPGDGDLTENGWTLPPRRAAARPVEYGDGDRDRDRDGHSPETAGGRTATGTWNWHSYASKSVRAVERHRSRSRKIYYGDSVVDDSHHPFEMARPPTKVTPLTPRRMRRMWRDVWETTSYVTERQENRGKGTSNKDRKWDFVWGLGRPEVWTAAHNDAIFFEGVDAKGKVMASSSRQRGSRARREDDHSIAR